MLKFHVVVQVVAKKCELRKTRNLGLPKCELFGTCVRACLEHCWDRLWNNCANMCWNRCGYFDGHVGNMFDTLLQHVRSTAATCLEHVWDIVGAFLQHVWNMRATCVETCRDDFGIWLEHCLIMCATCLTHLCNMRWNMFRTSLKHGYNSCASLLEPIWTQKLPADLDNDLLSGGI